MKIDYTVVEYKIIVLNQSKVIEDQSNIMNEQLKIIKNYEMLTDRLVISIKSLEKHEEIK